MREIEHAYVRAFVPHEAPPDVLTRTERKVRRKLKRRHPDYVVRVFNKPGSLSISGEAVEGVYVTAIGRPL